MSKVKSRKINREGQSPVMFWLPTELAERLAEFCKERRTKKAAEVRMAIERHITYPTIPPVVEPLPIPRPRGRPRKEPSPEVVGK